MRWVAALVVVGGVNEEYAADFKLKIMPLDWKKCIEYIINDKIFLFLV